jgi:tetratricopeptide (TPR) repeat protein
MQIKRDYSEPFFRTHRRKKRHYGRALFVFGLLVGSLLLVVLTQFDDLQETALGMFGQLATPTPFPGELATEAMQRFRDGNMQGAAALFEQVITQRPDDLDYLYEYGQLLIEMDDHTRALELADHMLEIDAQDVRGYALKARGLVWSGDADSAISLGAIGLGIDRGFAPLHAVLARAYTDTANYQKALEHAELAVGYDPLNAEAHRSYAYALSAVKLNDQAIDELEQAIALNPNLAALYFELAYQYLAQDMNDDAIATYDRVLSLQPRNAKAMLRLCLAYSKIGQFDRALGYCQDAITNDPEYSAAYQQVGMILYNRLDFSGSLDAFETCARLDTTNLECLYRSGLSHYYLNDCDAAWSILQDSLIMAQIRTGQEKAIDNIRQGLTAIIDTCPGYSHQEATPEVLPETTEVSGDS